MTLQGCYFQKKIQKIQKKFKFFLRWEPLCCRPSLLMSTAASVVSPPSMWAHTESTAHAFCQSACLTARRLDEAVARNLQLESELREAKRQVELARQKDERDREAERREKSEWTLERTAMVLEMDRLKMQIGELDARCAALRQAQPTSIASAFSSLKQCGEGVPGTRDSAESLKSVIMDLISQAARRIDVLEKHVQGLSMEAERADRIIVENQAGLETSRKTIAEAHSQLVALQDERQSLSSKSRADETELSKLKFETKMLVAQLTELKQVGFFQALSFALPTNEPCCRVAQKGILTKITRFFFS